jgi:hypothetical protein
MNRCLLSAAAAAVFALAGPVSAQVAPQGEPDLGAPRGPQGDTWASIANLPDWGGLWEPAFGGGRDNPKPMLTPAYEAKFKAYQAAVKSGKIQDTPSANCVPPGLPGIMTQPYPIEFLFTPGKVTVLIEAYSQWRQIFTDGRPHPKDPDPTFNGNSIGHWEGDTLVVDSVAFLPEVPMGGEYGLEHSDKMRIVERMRETNPNTLEIETTIYDPIALQKPWTTKRTYGRHKDWTLAEYVCQENNRNYTTTTGKAGVDLDYNEAK